MHALSSTRQHGPRPSAPPQRSPGADAGFTIVEAMIGVVILTVSLGSLAVLSARQWSSSGNIDVQDRLENAVARDHGWLKTYAKQWRLGSGPYDVSCTQAGFAADCDTRVVTNTITDYQPDETRCATATGLAQDFLNAARTVTITPARPFAIPSVPSDGTSASTIKGDPLPVTGLPTGTALYRTIRISNTPAEKNIVYLSYSFEGTGADAYGFVREVAIRPEASSWCP